MNFILAMCVCDQLCPDLCDSLDCSPPGSSVYGVPGNIGVGSHFLLQEIIPDLGIKPMSLESPALAGEFFHCNTLEAQILT